MTKSNQKGITLIETLIYVGIVGLVLVGFINYSLTVTNNREKSYVVSEVHANNRNAIELINKTMFAATGVNVGDSVFDSDPGTLSLSFDNAALNPTIITLDQDDGSLTIKEGLSDPQIITSDKVNVSNLIFTNLSKNNRKETIKIEMTTQYDNTAGGVIYNYSQDIETVINLRQ